MGAKWLLLLCGSATALRAAGAARCLAPRTTSFSMMTAAGERTFCRAKDLLSTGERATAREVVNVLGRWQSHAQWNEIGAAKQLDRVDPTDGFLAYRRSRVRADPDRTPMRRAACRKLGQAQRFLLKENVGSLPFKSANLAASVGATPAELNREPISELACDISSIVEKRLADANRARYEASDGKFAADTFASDLAAGRRTIAISMAIFPGSLNALFLYLFFRWGSTFTKHLLPEPPTFPL
eukprot:scaffold1518_cov109-Isochrysis_galbana.AAC.1